MRPLLANGIELPAEVDENWVEGIEILRSRSETVHVHLIPRESVDMDKELESEHNTCIQLGCLNSRFESKKCAQHVHYHPASRDTAVVYLTRSAAIDADMQRVFEGDMVDLDTMPHNDRLALNPPLATEYSDFRQVPARTEPNINHLMSRNGHLPIIDHLLDTLTGGDSSKLVADSENIYKELLNRRGAHQLKEDLVAALELDIKQVYQHGQLNLATLEGLEQTKAAMYDGPGVYLHVVLSGDEDGVFSLYVGAATNVANRIAQHHQHRRTPSRRCLHYYMWNMSRDRDFFILLSTLHDTQSDSLDETAMLNLLEEWGCLTWQTLPHSILRKSLPEAAYISESNIHLNRASPLRQKYNCKGHVASNLETAQELHTGAQDYRESHDPLVAAYFQDMDAYYRLPMTRKMEALRLGHQIQKASHYKAATNAARRQPRHRDDLFRDADPSLGDEANVWIQCACCRHPSTKRLDPAPLYERCTGLYVRRKLGCHACADPSRELGKFGGIYNPRPTEPVDYTFPSVSMHSVRGS